MATQSPTYSTVGFGKYTTLLGAGRCTTQDAATVVNPESSLTTTYHKVVNFGHDNDFTHVSLQFGYDPSLTGITNMTGALFGRHRAVDGSVDNWRVLRNRGGNRSCTFACVAATDTQDGSLCRTEVDESEHVFFRDGCNEFVWGVETAFAGTGTTTTAVLNIKKTKRTG